MYSRAKVFFFLIKSQVFSALIQRQNIVKTSKNIELFPDKKNKSSVKYWAKDFPKFNKKPMSVHNNGQFCFKKKERLLK
jgi:hypothetical protein